MLTVNRGKLFLKGILWLVILPIPDQGPGDWLSTGPESDL